MSEKEFHGTNLIISLDIFNFKRGYCAVCGRKFKRKITLLEEIVKYKPFGIPFLKEKFYHQTIITSVYKCKDCQYMIEYDKQKKISKQQKLLKSKVLDDGLYLVKKYKIK